MEVCGREGFPSEKVAVVGAYIANIQAMVCGHVHLTVVSSTSNKVTTDDICVTGRRVTGVGLQALVRVCTLSDLNDQNKL